MAEKLLLTNRALLKLNTGLRNLDGVASEAGKIKRFEFDDKVAWNIAKNTVLVERTLEAYDRARKSLMAKHSLVEGSPLTTENAPQYAAFMEEIEKMKDKQVELPGILFLKLDDLMGGGKIPPSVLADLMVIIKE